MNTKFLVVTAFLAASNIVSAETSSLTSGVKSMISGMVSTGKNAIKGVNEGIDDGRKSGESVDGAVIVSSQQTLEKNITASVQLIEKVAEGRFNVTLALRNYTDKNVRLINLNERNSLQLLDKEGFVSYITSTGTPQKDITIPAKAATRVRYEFSEMEGVPAKLRLYGLEIDVPAVKM